MSAPPRKIAWIIAPPALCCLCKEPLTQPDETSSWNGTPAHRECVRVHLINRDPAFREGEPSEEPAEPEADQSDGIVPRDDDESDFG